MMTPEQARDRAEQLRTKLWFSGPHDWGKWDDELTAALLAVQKETIAACDEDLRRCREALRPLARIPLWRDTYPDGPDILDNRAPPSVAAVRAARTALGEP